MIGIPLRGSSGGIKLVRGALLLLSALPFETVKSELTWEQQFVKHANGELNSTDNAIIVRDGGRGSVLVSCKAGKIASVFVSPGFAYGVTIDDTGRVFSVPAIIIGAKRLERPYLFLKIKNTSEAELLSADEIEKYLSLLRSGVEILKKDVEDITGADEHRLQPAFGEPKAGSE